MNNLQTYSCVAAIGGTDPTGGAGVQADIKSIAATGGYGATIICALVSQNTQGVKSIFEIPTEIVGDQIDCVFNDLNIKAIKIGMLHNHQHVLLISKLIKEYRSVWIVLDPVMIAKDSSRLSSKETIEIITQELFFKAHLITPNLYEAEQLLNTKISSLSEQKNAAIELGKKFQTNFLVKGGHLDDPFCIDVLFIYSENACHIYSAKKIITRNTHGAGCSLASAIASFLAQNYTLNEAVKAAKNYLTQAIISGSHKMLGKGYGPIDHFYK